MKRLTVGIDGNALYVGLGDLLEGDFVFQMIDTSPNAKSLRSQSKDLIEIWHEEFPEHGRLSFDWVDGL